MSQEIFVATDPAGREVRLLVERVVDGAIAAWVEAYPDKPPGVSRDYADFVKAWAVKNAWKLDPFLGHC